MRNKCTFIFLILLSSAFGSTFYYEDGTVKKYSTPRLKPGPDSFKLNAQVTFNRPFETGHCLHEPDTEDPNGKVVLVMGELQACERFYKKVRPLQDQGAVGILFARDDYNGDSGLLYYWTMCTKGDCDGISIPLVEIGRDDSRHLYKKLSKGENVTVELTDDPNAFGEPLKAGAYYALSAISITLSLVVLCYASYRLHEFVSVKGWILTLNSAVFSLEIWASLLRIIWCIDPWAFYGVYPLHMSQIMVTTHAVPALIANLLLACYWQESIRSFHIMQRIPRLRKFKWPLIVFGILLFCADLIAGFLRSLGNQQATTGSIAVITLFFAVVTIASSVFFIASGILVLKQLDSGVTKLSGKAPKKNLNLFTALIIVVAIGAMVILLLNVLFAFILVRKAWLMYMAILLLFTVLEIIGFTRTLIFQSPGKKIVSSSSNSKVVTNVQMLKQMSQDSDVPMATITDSDSGSLTVA